MKLPRVPCPRCGRPTAAGPVAGRISKGRLWRHDDPGMLRVPDGPLVSCSGSLSLVDMPLPGRQLELDVEPEELSDVEPEPTMALF
ncbi:hypothetical protein [Streptomyces boncukensis]|uniref:Uncharacterized protein n=1 Tax=Streptomyces boncukensis TaxID=2711219 RepID=A0A6G4WQF8_9ACTN|nr:hypothetical protein [Streptomyces boncukensis]NGO66794.1 hypothetical protein [Streptomyces boncukensis]